MKNITIDDEVFSSLLKNVADFEESPNSVLRRLLGLDGNGGGLTPQKGTKLPIHDFLATTEFRFARGVIGRLLAILSWLYAQNPDGFGAVREVKGRDRLYFSTDREELERSGKSVKPKQIPGSDYWVISTSPTNLKRAMLSQAMQALKYDRASIEAALKALGE